MIQKLKAVKKSVNNGINGSWTVGWLLSLLRHCHFFTISRARMAQEVKVTCDVGILMRRILPKAGALTWNRVRTRTCPRSHVEFPQEGWNGAKLPQNWEWYAFGVPTMVYLWAKKTRCLRCLEIIIPPLVPARSAIEAPWWRCHPFVNGPNHVHPIAFWQTRKGSSGRQVSKCCNQKLHLEYLEVGAIESTYILMYSN